MRVSPSAAGRMVAEALVVIPALALALAWTGVIIAGLMDKELVALHQPEIERMMSFLLIGCGASFVAGLLLFVLFRGRRPVR